MDSGRDPQSAGSEVPSTPTAQAPAGAGPAAPGPPAAAAPPARAVTASAAKPVGAVVESTPDPPVNKMRRRIVWASTRIFDDVLPDVCAVLPAALILEPSSSFQSAPGDYALGVDTKWQQQYRIWVTRLPIAFS